MYSYTDTDKVPVDRREVEFHDQYQRFLVSEYRRLATNGGEKCGLTGTVDIQLVVFHD